MGNDERFSDRKGASHEWGSKGRKEDARSNKHRRHREAIEDSESSHTEPEWCGDCDAPDCAYCNPKAPTIEERRLGRKRRNTKRWCRGKEGQEHDPQYLRSWGFGRWRYREYACSRCGQRTHERNRGGQADG